MERMAQQIDCATIMSLLADERLERTADYVRRKRPLLSAETDDLKARWVRQFRLFVSRPADRHVSDLLEDLESELALRGAELPQAEIREDAIAFVEDTFARTEALPADELARINDALTRQFKRHLARRGRRQ